MTDRAKTIIWRVPLRSTALLTVDARKAQAFCTRIEEELFLLNPFCLLHTVLSCLIFDYLSFALPAFIRQEQYHLHIRLADESVSNVAVLLRWNLR